MGDEFDETVNRLTRVVDALRSRNLTVGRIELCGTSVTVDGLAPITPTVDRPSPEPVDARRPPRA